jgi:hypothetical protein
VDPPCGRNFYNIEIYNNKNKEMRNLKTFEDIKESAYPVNEGMQPERMKLISDYYNLIFKADPNTVKSFLSAKFDMENTKGDIIAKELLNGLAHAYEAVPEAFNKPGLSSGATVKADMQTILKFGGLG